MNKDLLKESYLYELPKELIAQRPHRPRDESRLLVYDEEKDMISHHHFYEFPNFLYKAENIVFNNSKVFPCRLLGQKTTGGQVEVFILDYPRDVKDYGPVRALIKASGKRSVGEKFLFDSFTSIINDLGDGHVSISFDRSLIEILEEYAGVPIPPYIRNGRSDLHDKSDYQTMYAKTPGSVAAPTAGLHFTDRVFKGLDAKNIKRLEVTLNVGLGTFAPMKSDDLLSHKMHSEFYNIESEDLSRIQKSYGDLIAVGTTSLRVLESIDSKYSGDWRETNIFLYPGKEVKSISGLLTNFHLPESTLLMLVSALIGREKTLEIYKVAVQEGYRFFSYGDAMFIRRKKNVL